jgi:hypothetical protein
MGFNRRKMEAERKAKADDAVGDQPYPIAVMSLVLPACTLHRVR